MRHLSRKNPIRFLLRGTEAGYITGGGDRRAAPSFLDNGSRDRDHVFYVGAFEGLVDCVRQAVCARPSFVVTECSRPDLSY